jgi:hypothetical protein
VAPVFALIALLLAAMRLYAVIAHSVSQRNADQAPTIWIHRIGYPLGERRRGNT